MPGPIGISFLPSEEQAANGPMQGNMEGDLGQALKILSLHLPRVLGGRPIASPRLMTNPGGFNPMQAVIQALLQAGGFPTDGSPGAGGYGANSMDPTRVSAGDAGANSTVVADPGASTRSVPRPGMGGDAGTINRGPWGVSDPNLGVDRSGFGGGGVGNPLQRRSPWSTY